MRWRLTSSQLVCDCSTTFKELRERSGCASGPEEVNLRHGGQETWASREPSPSLSRHLPRAGHSSRRAVSLPSAARARHGQRRVRTWSFRPVRRAAAGAAAGRTPGVCAPAVRADAVLPAGAWPPGGAPCPKAKAPANLGPCFWARHARVAAVKPASLCLCVTVPPSLTRLSLRCPPTALVQPSRRPAPRWPANQRRPVRRLPPRGGAIPPVPAGVCHALTLA